MRRTLGGLCGVAALACAGAVQAESDSFGDWTVVCDNVRTCSAYGFAEETSEATAYIRIARAGGAAAAPTLTISGMGEGSALWRLEIDGIAVVRDLRAGAAEGEVYQRAALDPAQSASLLRGLANGGLLSIWRGRDIVSVISLKGSSAALRWMDDRQGRGGTVTALVAKGPKPASAVPAPPPPPLIAPAAPISQAGLPKALPDAMKHPGESCDDDIESLGVEPQVFRLGTDVLLWQTACSRGAYNIIYDLTLTDERGRLGRGAVVAYPGGERTSQLMNVEFDAGSQTLTNFDKGRGLGDCGAFSSWVWTGRAFALKSSDLMPACRGVPLDDWPTEFVSR